jgi:hypothetical protein
MQSVVHWSSTNIIHRAANFFQRTEHSAWTPSMNESLHILAEKNDYATDLLLVSLVRVQLLRYKIATVEWSELSSQAFYFETFKAQLEEVRGHIPADLQTNCM